MRLINTTSTHQELIRQQLKNTDATLVETFTAGNTDVVFSQAPSHYEILISNKHRTIKDSELEAIREFFLKRRINRNDILPEKIKTIHTPKLIELSIPIK